MLIRNKYVLSLILLSNIFIGCGGSSSSSDTTLSQISTLSLDTKKSLAYMGNEERLAYDIYNKFYDLFPSLIQFNNIAVNSETRHIDAVQQLVQKYEITGTELSDSNYTSLYYQNTDLSQMQAGVYGVLSVQQLYNTLLVEGSNDDISALKVGCKVEVTDIEDLDKYLVYAKNDNASDVVEIFEFLRAGSYSHYWTFDAALKSKNVVNGCNLGVEPYGDKNGIYPVI
jgi:hypothetical protein